MFASNRVWWRPKKRTQYLNNDTIICVQWVDAALYMSRVMTRQIWMVLGRQTYHTSKVDRWPSSFSQGPQHKWLQDKIKSRSNLMPTVIMWRACLDVLSRTPLASRRPIYALRRTICWVTSLHGPLDWRAQDQTDSIDVGGNINTGHTRLFNVFCFFAAATFVRTLVIFQCFICSLS